MNNQDQTQGYPGKKEAVHTEVSDGGPDGDYQEPAQERDGLGSYKREGIQEGRGFSPRREKTYDQTSHQGKKDHQLRSH